MTTITTTNVICTMINNTHSIHGRHTVWCTFVCTDTRKDEDYDDVVEEGLQEEVMFGLYRYFIMYIYIYMYV